MRATMRSDELKRDYKGHKLCLHCFNNAHFVRRINPKTNKKIQGPAGLGSNCLCGGCECLCRELLKELTARPKKENHGNDQKRTASFF